MTTKIGQIVKDFYDKTPFPDYELDRFNSKEDLKLAASDFAEILDRSMPVNATVIDVGTGTGQLSAFLSLRRKCVWGIDFSDSSLNKAEALKRKLKLNSLHLKRVDILDIKQIESIGMKFDYVLCLGVLHHTGNAYHAFKNILKLLKPNGHIAVGLYNKFGRIPHKLRKFLVKSIFKNSTKVKELFLKMQIGDIHDKEKVRGWWNDQYLHPHETTHAVGKVLEWFKQNKIEYSQAIPSLTSFDNSDLEISGVWNNTNEVFPSFFIRFYKQLSWIWRTHREGGYFIVFGKRG